MINENLLTFQLVAADSQNITDDNIAEIRQLLVKYKRAIEFVTSPFAKIASENLEFKLEHYVPGWEMPACFPKAPAGWPKDDTENPYSPFFRAEKK